VVEAAPPVHLAVFVGAGTEALDGGDDHARIQLLDAFPGKAHAVQCPGREILHQHVAIADQGFQHFLAGRVLGIERDRALVMVQHREVQAVHVGDVAQLGARGVALAGPFDLDHVGPEPRQQLGTRGPRLYMGKIENPDAFQCLAQSCLLRCFYRPPSGHLIETARKQHLTAVKIWKRGRRALPALEKNLAIPKDFVLSTFATTDDGTSSWPGRWWPSPTGHTRMDRT
jgi:hypothetical protein